MRCIQPKVGNIAVANASVVPPPMREGNHIIFLAKLTQMGQYGTQLSDGLGSTSAEMADLSRQLIQGERLTVVFDEIVRRARLPEFNESQIVTQWSGVGVARLGPWRNLMTLHGASELDIQSGIRLFVYCAVLVIAEFCQIGPTVFSSCLADRLRGIDIPICAVSVGRDEEGGRQNHDHGHDRSPFEYVPKNA
jgi:hypothetical protein